MHLQDQNKASLRFLNQKLSDGRRTDGQHFQSLKSFALKQKKNQPTKVQRSVLCVFKFDLG